MWNRTMRLARFLGCAALLVACGGSTQGDGFDGGDGGGGSDGTVGHHDARSDGPILNLGGDSGPEGSMGCTGLACQVEKCSSGIETSVSGYVYAPNGTLPLYDVQVFIPNAPLDPFPKGVQCQNCGTPISGAPITTALSDSTGAFKLTGVPTGTNIPIVVQLGKWRRETYIPKVTGCTNNVLTDPNMTRLPKTQKEGSMPHIVLTTGGCDNMGCMLPKIGIDPSEFGYQSDGYNKAVNVYNGQTGGDTGATPASNLWSNSSLLNTYDLAVFSCECEEPPEAPPGSTYYSTVTDYLSAGGRIFTTDFMYTWYKYSPDTNLGGGSYTPYGSTTGATIGIGEIAGGAPGGGSPVSFVSTFPKGLALTQWIKYVFSGKPLPSGATYPYDPASAIGQDVPDVVFGNVQYVDPKKTVTWATSPYSSYGGPPPPMGSIEPRVFTVDTPVGKASDMQCGRGVHLDIHIDQADGESVGPGYPTTGCNTTLRPQEAMFAFFFFDLASCIQNDMQPPAPPPPVK